MRFIDWLFASGFAERLGLTHSEATIILLSNVAIALASLTLVAVLARILWHYWHDPSMRYLRLFKGTLVLVLILRALEATLSAWSFRTPYYNLITLLLALSAAATSFFVLAALPQLRYRFWLQVRGLVEERAGEQVNEIIAATRRLNEMQHAIRDRTATLERIVYELDALRPLSKALKGGACPLVPATLTALDAAEKAGEALAAHEATAAKAQEAAKALLPPEAR